MTLKTQMASDMSIFFNADEFAETISYTASGESATDISAVVDRSGELLEAYVRGERTAMITITVKKADVSNLAYGDIFTIDSEEWNFDPERGVIYEDDDTVQIALERDMP